MRARCSDVILVIADLPACQRCCDLAQQGFHQHRQIDLLCGCQLDAGLVLLEQARLEILGWARHYWLPPSLIRTGESLGAYRSRHAGTAEYRGKNEAHRRARIEPQPRASSTQVCRRASCRVAE